MCAVLRIAAPAYARVDLVPSDDGPLVLELEVVEPDLGLRLDREATEAFVSALVTLLDDVARPPGVEGDACAIDLPALFREAAGERD